jgi:hypothetical protein
MTSSDLRQTLLAINSTEWLNLCARGSIRMSKRRPVSVSKPVSDKEMEKVFASAPFTKLSSSVDLFVLVLNDEWVRIKRGHRSNPSEILQLSLSDVLKHHPVALEHFEYYSNIGNKCGVQLGEPVFEQAWVYWITNETLQASCDAGDRLQRAFQINLSSQNKRADKYKWEEIARLVLRPNEPIKAKPAHAETLLSNIRPIADAVSATRNSEQFYIACAIEWIDTRLKKDPLKKKTQKEVLLAALESAKGKPLGQPSEQTALALQLLSDAYPKAFTNELSPIAIAHIVQLLTESRTRKLKPETVIRIFNSIDHTSTTASLTSFALATSLGIELTNQLILIAGQDNPTDWDWNTAD